MLFRWLQHLIWQPFERFCHRLPLVPLRAHIKEPLEGVKCIRIDNFVTRALARLGGYDYSISYLVDDSLLIDTGFGWARRTLRRVLSDLHAQESLEYAVNTHYHEDHTGNNDLIRELTRARVFAHPDALAEIRFPVEKVWYRRFLFGPAPPMEAEPVPERLVTKHGEFVVHHMPGHCPGHICLFEPNRKWLFSGDLYISANLDSQLGDADGPRWITSLERAIELAPKVLLDGHGVVVHGQESVLELLSHKLSFLQELRNRILDAASAAQTVQSITKRVFGARGLTNRLSFSDGKLSLLTCADFSRSNLVKSFLRESPTQTPTERLAPPNQKAL